MAETDSIHIFQPMQKKKGKNIIVVILIIKNSIVKGNESKKKQVNRLLKWVNDIATNPTVTLDRGGGKLLIIMDRSRGHCEEGLLNALDAIGIKQIR